MKKVVCLLFIFIIFIMLLISGCIFESGAGLHRDVTGSEFIISSGDDSLKQDDNVNNNTVGD
jgi:hypothetical protein